jgi:hypothetical protein
MVKTPLLSVKTGVSLFTRLSTGRDFGPFSLQRLSFGAEKLLPLRRNAFRKSDPFASEVASKWQTQISRFQSDRRK